MARIFLLFCALSPAFWGTMPVPSFPLAVVDSVRQGRLLTVTLENRGNKAITAWTIKVLSETSPRGTEVSYSGMDVFRTVALRRLGLRAVGDGGLGIVATGERAAHQCRVPVESVVREIDVISVIFEDGTWMGEEMFASPMLRKREALASTCDRWAIVVDLASQQSDLAGAVSVLSGELGRARQRGAGPTTDDEIPNMIDDAVRSAGSNRTEFASKMRFLREYLREMSAEGRRHLK